MTDELDQCEADAVMAGLLGAALAPCPQCGTKTLTTTFFKNDQEHPDEEYRCPECNLRWSIYMPEGLVQSIDPGGKGSTILKGLIPFDAKGNQLRYTSQGRMRPNFIFNDTLVWVDNERSRYSYNFVYRRQSTGTLVSTMATDFKKFLPEMIKGSVTGTFTFRKCGGTAGVTFYKEKPPKKPRGKKKP